MCVFVGHASDEGFKQVEERLMNGNVNGKEQGMIDHRSLYKK